MRGLFLKWFKHLNLVVHIIPLLYFKHQQFNDKNTSIANFSIIPFDICTCYKCFFVYCTRYWLMDLPS